MLMIKIIVHVLFVLIWQTLLINVCIADELKQPLVKQVNSKDSTRKAIVVKPSSLLHQPDFKSDIITTLQKDQQLSITKRQRAWYQVSKIWQSKKASKQPSNDIANESAFEGWINMLNVRFAHSAKRDGDLGLSALINSASNDSLPTTSTGVRGFDKALLAKAKANLAQLALLEEYKVSRQQAILFAQQGKLDNKQQLGD